MVITESEDEAKYIFEVKIEEFSTSYFDLDIIQIRESYKLQLKC